MRVVSFILCLVAYGSALHLYIDRQQTNIGPIVGHMSTALHEEHGPAHVVITDPQQEGAVFYNASADVNNPNRFSSGILSALGSGLAGMMTQWLGQLAGGMIPVIGDFGSSVAEAITGGIVGQGNVEDNDPIEEDYPMAPSSGPHYPVKPCKPKPVKPHKPFHKPIGYLVHVPQEGNYLVLHQPVQNNKNHQEPENGNIEKSGNTDQEGKLDENKEMTESSTMQQETTGEIQQNNNNINETVTIV